MEKNLRLKKNKDFTFVYKRGKSCWNKNFTLFYKKNKLENSRVGFSISKKYGNAVKRNYIKRRLREIVRHNKELLPSETDIILIPKKNTYNMSYNLLEKSVIHILSVLKEKRGNN